MKGIITNGSSERNLPSDPNAIQLTLNLFTDEDNAESENRLRDLENEESKKTVTVPEHTRHRGNRTIDYSGLEVKENIIDPREVLDSPEGRGEQRPKRVYESSECVK